MTATNWARLALVLLGALIVQVSVIDQVVVLGEHADVMVLLVGAAGLVAGPQRGAIMGFVVGLVADLVVATPFGLSSLTFVLVGFGFGLLRFAPAAREARSVQIAACVAAGAIGTIVFAILGALLGQAGMLGRTGLDAVLVVTLGSVILAWPCLAVVGWVFRGADRPRAGLGVPSGGSAAL